MMDATTPHDLVRAIGRYRRLLGEYRALLRSMRLDPTPIERVMLGLEHSTYKRQTLESLRVWIDRSGLKNAGVSERGIAECADWVRSLEPPVQGDDAGVPS
jgi:hypothetical protein